MIHGFPVFIPVLFFIFLFGLNWAIPFISGWNILAQHYRTIEKFEGPLQRPWSAYMRSGTKYGWTLKMGTNEQGLYMKASMDHPALFIPWKDITYVEKKDRAFFFTWGMNRFFFKDCGDVYLEITRNFSEKVGLAQYARKIEPQDAPRISTVKEVGRWLLAIGLLLGLAALSVFSMAELSNIRIK